MVRMYRLIRKVTYDTVGKYSYTVTEENAGQTINGGLIVRMRQK